MVVEAERKITAKENLSRVFMHMDGSDAGVQPNRYNAQHGAHFMSRESVDVTCGLGIFLFDISLKIKLHVVFL